MEELNLKQERNDQPSMDGGCQEDAIKNANAERNIEGNSMCTRTKLESLPTSDIRQELFCAKCSLQFGNK